MSRNAFMGVLAIAIIFAATMVILTEFGNFGIAQGQVNPTLTPEQKVCDPNDQNINTTESKICSVPQTPSEELSVVPST
jgi:hypothetical protein